MPLRPLVDESVLATININKILDNNGKTIIKNKSSTPVGW